jgi:hypothetical protein
MRAFSANGRLSVGGWGAFAPRLETGGSGAKGFDG